MPSLSQEKGADCYQIVNGVKEEYPGDAAIAERYLIINERRLEIFLAFLVDKHQSFLSKSTANSYLPSAFLRI